MIRFTVVKRAKVGGEQRASTAPTHFIQVSQEH
jgi:hypothetical protein